MLPVRLLRRQSSISSCENSFLKEVEYNNCISKEIREVVEYRFRLSKINSNYVFPRKKISMLDSFLDKKKRSKTQPLKGISNLALKKNTSNKAFQNSFSFLKPELVNRAKPKPYSKTLSLSFLNKSSIGYNPNLRIPKS